MYGSFDCANIIIKYGGDIFFNSSQDESCLTLLLNAIDSCGQQHLDYYQLAVFLLGKKGVFSSRNVFGSEEEVKSNIRRLEAFVKKVTPEAMNYPDLQRTIDDPMDMNTFYESISTLKQSQLHVSQQQPQPQPQQPQQPQSPYKQNSMRFSISQESFQEPLQSFDQRSLGQSQPSYQPPVVSQLDYGQSMMGSSFTQVSYQQSGSLYNQNSFVEEIPNLVISENEEKIAQLKIVNEYFQILHFIIE